MCHPAPGPRCSAHAYAEYIHALQAYETAPDAAEVLRRGEVLAAKRALYDSTPRGQRALDRARNRETDFGKVLELQKRLEDGQALRKSQLAAYHAVVDVKSNDVKTQLRAAGVRSRYEYAAGIVFAYLSAHENRVSAEIEQVDTIALSAADAEYKIFVLPQKYQHVWASVKRHDGRYVLDGSEAMAQVLNVDAVGSTLSAQAATTVGNWFADLLRERGYHLFAGVNTLTERVHIGLIDELPAFVNVGVRLQAKPTGTSAYSGEMQALKKLLPGTVFEGATISRDPKHGRVTLSGVGRQATRLCRIGNLYMAWQDATDTYEVRQRHVSATADVIVKTTHKQAAFESGLSTQAVALLGGDLI